MTELKKEHVKQFALAGNATITLKSGVTGKHLTYKISRSKDNADLYFVRLLHGPDNENDYQYIGCYYADTPYFHPCKKWNTSPRHALPQSVRVIDWFFEHIDDIPDKLYVYHEGKCGRCGRKLTTPESIERGLGPECARY